MVLSWYVGTAATVCAAGAAVCTGVGFVPTDAIDS
jgi:hypothetical protein